METGGNIGIELSSRGGVTGDSMQLQDWSARYKWGKGEEEEKGEEEKEEALLLRYALIGKMLVVSKILVRYR